MPVQPSRNISNRRNQVRPMRVRDKPAVNVTYGEGAVFAVAVMGKWLLITGLVVAGMPRGSQTAL